MDFLPTGMITSFSMAVIWPTAVGLFIFGGKDQKLIALALVTSWFGARYATAANEYLLYACTLTVAGAFSYYSFTTFSRHIAILYALRLLLVAALACGAISWFWLWELNRPLLYMQIILAIGGAGEGGNRKRLGGFAYPDRRIDNAVSVFSWDKLTRHLKGSR